MKFHGGIDLGGTKIEAALFDADMVCLDKRRIATPRSYPELLDEIVLQANWLRERAGESCPIGLGCPGFFDDETGLVHSANLPLSGKPFKQDIQQRVQHVSVGQDLKCFALSEANGGAGAGARHLFGLILGTGLGGALCIDGLLVMGRQGLAGEIGHVPVSARSAARYGLPETRCGCGLQGCLETWVAGPGMSRLAEHFGLGSLSPPEIIGAEANGDKRAANVVTAWLDLACEALLVVQLSTAPDIVVLGGGLSRITGIADRLALHFESRCLPGSKAPRLSAATFGDSSGTRGAAMLARQATVLGGHHDVSD